MLWTLVRRCQAANTFLPQTWILSPFGQLLRLAVVTAGHLIIQGVWSLISRVPEQEKFTPNRSWSFIHQRYQFYALQLRPSGAQVNETILREIKAARPQGDPKRRASRYIITALSMSLISYWTSENQKKFLSKVVGTNLTG